MNSAIKLVGNTIIVGSLFAFSGCGPKFYQIDSKYIEEDNSKIMQEIVKTAEYTQEIGKIKTIAIAAPERCKSETVASATGAVGSAGAGIVMKTECGLEMGEIEKSLAKSGFQVISWQIIANAESMAKISNQNITRQQIALQQGADALFQINSIEKTQSKSSSNARWDRKYYISDIYGTNQGSASINQRMQNLIQYNIAGQENRLLSQVTQRPSVTIDASVIGVKTGRSIWFYQRTKSEDLDERKMSLKQYLQCDGEDVCWPTRPLNSTQENTSDKIVTGSSTAISTTQNANDELQARYYALLRSVISDMVTTFKE